MKHTLMIWNQFDLGTTLYAVPENAPGYDTLDLVNDKYVGSEMEQGIENMIIMINHRICDNPEYYDPNLAPEAGGTWTAFKLEAGERGFLLDGKQIDRIVETGWIP